MTKIPLLFVSMLSVLSCEKGEIDPKSADQKDQSIIHYEALKCLTPYNGPSKGLFTTNQNDLFTTIAWDRSKEIRSEKLPLNETLFTMKITEVGPSFTGRFLLYRDLGGQSKLLGSVADFKELRYDSPSLRLLPGTRWLESQECVGAGTGIATYWSRFWKIGNDDIQERLALPTKGHQRMSTAAPCQEFTLKPIPSQCSDKVIMFEFRAVCELIVQQDSSEGISIKLPDIIRTIYFEEDPMSSMILNEEKSGLTLREFQILTNTQLEFGPDFWEIYAYDIEQITQGTDRESVRAWIDSNKTDSWVIPDKIKSALKP